MKKKTRNLIIIICVIIFLAAGFFLYYHFFRKRVDIIIFMGQSNIAGRGSTSEIWPETAPEVMEGAGWEFRAVTDPSKLYPIQEPFGIDENLTNFVDDEKNKTGSLVSAFVNAYYSDNGNVPVVAVSASKGGTTIMGWAYNGGYLHDAITRLKSARSFVEQSGYLVRHIYAVWCQGESDADRHTQQTNYYSAFEDTVSQLKNAGVEKVLMISIGHMNDEKHWDLYEDMIAWQADIADKFPDVVMVSDDFTTMRDRGLMKDAYHYYQAGYNECGTIAGKNAAMFARHGKTGALHFTEE